MRLFGKKETPKPTPSPKKENHDSWVATASQDTLIQLPIYADTVIHSGEVTIIYTLCLVGKQQEATLHLPIIQKAGSREELKQELHELIDGLFNCKLKGEVSNEANRSKQTKKRRGKTNSK